MRSAAVDRATYRAAPAGSPGQRAARPRRPPPRPTRHPDNRRGRAPSPAAPGACRPCVAPRTGRHPTPAGRDRSWLGRRSRPLARPPGLREWAHQNPGARDPLEPLAEAQGIVLAARGARDVCPTGMLTGACPSGLAMPRHRDLRKRCHHDCSCDALCSTSGDGQCRSHPEARATISSVHCEAGWRHCPWRLSDLSSPGLARNPCRAVPAPPGATMRGRISRRAAPQRACAILLACQTP